VKLLLNLIKNLAILAEFGFHCGKDLPDFARSLLNSQRASETLLADYLTGISRAS
jgi:hypothetical protein